MSKKIVGYKITPAVLEQGFDAGSKAYCVLSDSVHLRMAYDGVWLTTDGGVTWTGINNKFNAAGTWDKGQFIKFNATTVMFTANVNDTAIPVYITHDAGETWETVSGLTFNDCKDTLLNDTAVTSNGVMLYVAVVASNAPAEGTTPRAAFKSTDNGSTWTQLESGKADESGSKYNYLLLDNARLLRCFYKYGSPKDVAYSDDAGETWTAITYAGNTLYYRDSEYIQATEEDYDNAALLDCINCYPVKIGPGEFLLGGDGAVCIKNNGLIWYQLVNGGYASFYNFGWLSKDVIFCDGGQYGDGHKLIVKCTDSYWRNFDSSLDCYTADAKAFITDTIAEYNATHDSVWNNDYDLPYEALTVYVKSPKRMYIRNMDSDGYDGSESLTSVGLNVNDALFKGSYARGEEDKSFTPSSVSFDNGVTWTSPDYIKGAFLYADENGWAEIVNTAGGGESIIKVVSEPVYEKIKYAGENTLQALVAAIKSNLPDTGTLEQKLRSVSSYIRFKLTDWRATNVSSGTFYAFIKADDGTLVVGSADYSAGIKYSIDNGKTWTGTDKTGDYKAFGKADDGMLVAASGYDKGIKYSEDNGKTWTDTNVTSGSYSAFGKADDGTLVAANSNSGGVKYSEDNGKTWTNTNVTSGSYSAFGKADDGTLVVCSGLNGSGGIKYSEDNGKTWTNTNVTSGGYYSAFIKADDGTLVAGGSGIKYSEDNGKTWQDTNIASGNAFIKADDGTLVAGGSGIKYSEDNGKTWTNTNVTSGSYKAFGKVDDGTLVASGSGTKYSVDNGKTWQDTKVMSDNYNAFIKIDDGTLVAGGSDIKYLPALF